MYPRRSSVITAQFVCGHVEGELPAHLAELAVGACALQQFEPLAHCLSHALAGFGLSCFEKVGWDVNRDLACFAFHAIIYAISLYGKQRVRLGLDAVQQNG